MSICPICGLTNICAKCGEEIKKLGMVDCNTGEVFCHKCYKEDLEEKE